MSSPAAPPSAATHPGGDDAPAITAPPPPQEKTKPAPTTKPKKKPVPATKPKKKPVPATKPKKKPALAKKKPAPAKHSGPSPAKHSSPSACQHDNKEEYAMLDDKSYFVPKYLADTPSWPSACAKEGCDAAFGGNYKVGINRPVFCCLNAKNKNHTCVHAYCKPCFEAWQGAASGSSPRKRKAKRKYGE